MLSIILTLSRMEWSPSSFDRLLQEDWMRVTRQVMLAVLAGVLNSAVVADAATQHAYRDGHFNILHSYVTADDEILVRFDAIPSE